MQRVLFVAVWLLGTFSSSSADACGGWVLQDHGWNRRVVFLSHGIRVRPPNEKKRRAVLLVSELEVTGDTKLPPVGEHLDSVRSEHYSFAGEDVLFRTKAVGKLSGDTLQIADRVYRIAMKLREKDYHGLPMWEVAVRRGESMVVDGDAVHICAPAGSPGLTVKRELVRRRIAIYLAWRQLEGEASE